MGCCVSHAEAFPDNKPAGHSDDAEIEAVPCSDVAVSGTNDGSGSPDSQRMPSGFSIPFTGATALEPYTVESGDCLDSESIFSGADDFGQLSIDYVVQPALTLRRFSALSGSARSPPLRTMTMPMGRPTMDSFTTPMDHDDREPLTPRGATATHPGAVRNDGPLSSSAEASTENTSAASS